MTEREIFLAVLDLPDPTARAAYLAQTCGSDWALRAKVEALLASHESAGSFLGVPAVAAAAAATNTELLDENSTPSDSTVTRTDHHKATGDDDDLSLGFLERPTRPDSLGRIGHYEVLQVLGKGGFGIVFRAFDDVLQRVVAVKVMAPQLAATSPARKRFLREARSSAQVRHENVVQVYEIGEQPLPYLSMEFIPGETLQQRLDRTGPLEVMEVVRLGRQIADGLAAAHATDLIHRDIKPSNILLESGQEKVKLTDFGLARAADDASISQSGIIAGTPMYMAPEQAKGDKLDQRADVFSLGSVLYQMAAGRPPFRANGTVAVLKRVAEDTPRDIREIIPETPQWLCDIIAKLHEKKPDDRFQSAREVADVLADCEAQLKVNAKLKDYSRIPRSKPPRAGRRKWIAAAAVLLLPVIALVVTELAGVTHLVRVRPVTADPIGPDGGSMPASSPEVPKTAADVLPYLVGNWKLEKEDRDRKSPPDKDPFLGSFTYSFVSGGKFLRGRSSIVAPNVGPPREMLDLWSVEPGKNSMRRWVAHSTGIIHSNITGQFNPTSRTVTTDFPMGANYATHLYEFVDSNTFYHQVSTKTASGMTVVEFRNKWTRVAGPVTIPDVPLNPERPAEMAVLDRMIGEWSCKATATAPGDKTDANARVQTVPILGGRFVEQVITYEPSNLSDYALAWFDPASNRYRQWVFRYPGNVLDLTGTWDEAAKTITWQSQDKRLEGRTVFKGDDLHEFQQFVRDETGQMRRTRDGMARRVKPPPTFKNTLGMEFVIVPKGQSWLGGGKDKLGDKEVEIPADFYLGKYEVTQEEWDKVMGENPSYFSRTGEAKDVKDISDADLKRFPVESVSWDDCQSFVGQLNKLAKETGWVYRLPTETEWEYACRGGPMSNQADSAYHYYFEQPTNTVTSAQANVLLKTTTLNRTCKVGSYLPNRLGLYDMHGNIHEWCDNELPPDPLDLKAVSQRPLRGGSWGSLGREGHHQAGYRCPQPPSMANHWLGLRLARVPSGVPSPEAKTRQVIADGLKDAVLFMDFEKDTFYQKGGKTHVRDLSGNGNDGRCENVEFSPDGKTGGGLFCKEGEGRLQLAKSLILRQPNYTITAWCRWDKRTAAGTGTSLYRTCLPDLTNSVFSFSIPLERSVHVNAWNLNLLPKNWKNASTDAGAVPAGWFFVAVSLTDGETEKGKLRIVIDDKTHSRTSQVVATGNRPVDMVGYKMDGAVIDELAVFQRALSDEEIAAVRALGMKGTPLNVDKAPPAVAPFTDADVKRIAAQPAEQQIEEVRNELMRRNPGFDGTVGHKIEGGVVTELRIITDNVTDIAPIRVFDGLRVLELNGTYTDSRPNGQLADLSPLREMNLAGLKRLNLIFTKVGDAGLAPFKDCKNLTALFLENTLVNDAGLAHFRDCTGLTALNLNKTQVSDAGLAHFQGRENLTRLQLGRTKVSDAGLSYFKECKDLTVLNLVGTRVTDAGLAHLTNCTRLDYLNLGETAIGNAGLAHFKGCRELKWLEISRTGVTDLSLLRGMSLKQLGCNFRPERDAEILRSIKTLETINSKPAAEFWKDVDEQQSAAQAWLKRIAALPAAEQVEEVRKELMRRNPGFDGKFDHKIEDGVVTEFRIVTDQVTDVAPIRVFNALRVLACNGTIPKKGLLADLTPLKGMNLAGLTYLDLSDTKVTDAGMDCFKECKNLTKLCLIRTQVGDAGLVHFQNCKDLTELRLDGTRVSDAGLAHFQGCTALTDLFLGHTQVSDAGLAHLKNCRNLTQLYINNTEVGDAGLPHLKGMPLHKLAINNTRKVTTTSGITDLTPLQGMPLERIDLTPKNITRGLGILRAMKSLKTIGIGGVSSWPAAEFWERYDKGEFK